MQKNGFDIEMKGVLGGELQFAYMDTRETLGATFEIVKCFAKEMPALEHWGIYAPEDAGLIPIENKELSHIGIVVEDSKKTAQNYSEIFGVGPWTFVDIKPPIISDCTLHGISIVKDREAHIRIAFADLGGIQIKLIEPLKGASLYKDFLTQHGQGIHHLSFGTCEDYEEILSSMEKNGIDIATSGVLGGASRFIYMETRKHLGTLFEFGDSVEGRQKII
jgi:hypothetical protein